MKRIVILLLVVFGMAMQGMAQTRTPVSYIYEHAGYFKNGLAMVSKDNINYFFFNKEGEAVTHPLYSWCNTEWSEGLKAVKRNGKYGYIDSTGKEVIPCTLEYDGVEAFHDAPIRMSSTATTPARVTVPWASIRSDGNSMVTRSLSSWMSTAASRTRNGGRLSPSRQWRVKRE